MIIIYKRPSGKHLFFHLLYKLVVYLLLLITFTAFSQVYVWCPQNYLADMLWNEKLAPEIGARLQQSVDFWHVCHGSNTHNGHETQNTYLCRLLWWVYA